MTKVSTVLVLGASGMLGHVMLRVFAQEAAFETFGSARSARVLHLLPQALHGRIICGTDVENHDGLTRLFESVRPNVVINCVGLVKQLAAADDPLITIPINSLLPHRLLALCRLVNARLIQVSTDCVFAGTKGSYREEDIPDANDLYGRSKLLGEIGGPLGLTLRTSIIGPELEGAHGLIGWFLSQNGRVKGFTRAIFSGLTTFELARVIRDVVVPQVNLEGVYHVSAAPISKFDLLTMVAHVYGVSTGIEPDDKLVIDRSLDSTRFRNLTGYRPPTWAELVQGMHDFG